MQIDINKLNQKITIQKLTIVKDDLGIEMEKWVNFFETWCNANCLSGKEYWSASTVNAENTVVFTMRYCNALDNITPQEYKIVFNSADYDIKHVDNVQFANKIVKIKAVAIND